MVLSPENKNETVFILQPTALKEGEMWGRNLSNLNKWVDGDGNISVKFLIFYMYLWWHNRLLPISTLSMVQFGK